MRFVPPRRVRRQFNQLSGLTIVIARFPVSRGHDVGLDWQFAGVAPVRAPGASDLVLRNVNTGAFQVYNIANNQLTGSASLGAVGLDWQLGGFAGVSPTASMGSSDNSTSQLVQAMAGFGGGSGAADGLNAGFANIDASQQPVLTTPQHR